MGYLALLLLLWAAEQADCVTVIEEGKTYEILEGTTKTDLVCSSTQREAYWYSEGGTFPGIQTPSRYLTFTTPFTNAHKGEMACYLDTSIIVTLKFKPKPLLEIKSSNPNFRLYESVTLSCQAKPPIAPKFLKWLKNDIPLGAYPGSDGSSLEVKIPINNVNILTDVYKCFREDTNENVVYTFKLSRATIDLKTADQNYVSYDPIKPNEFGTIVRLSCKNTGQEQPLSASVELPYSKEMELPLGKTNNLYFVKKTNQGLDIYILPIKAETLGTYRCYAKGSNYNYKTTLYEAGKLIVNIRPTGPHTIFKGGQVHLYANVPPPFKVDDGVTFKWSDGRGIELGQNKDLLFNSGTKEPYNYGLIIVTVNAIDQNNRPISRSSSIMVKDAQLIADNLGQMVRNNADFSISCTLICDTPSINDVELINTNQQPDKQVDHDHSPKISGNQIIFNFKKVYQDNTAPLTYQCSLKTEHYKYVSKEIKVVVGQIDCPDNHRACADQRKCIPFFRFCDGTVDCLDESDESKDGACNPCNPVTEFECKNVKVRDSTLFPGERCVNMIWACDGEDDCGNESDEKIAACTSSKTAGLDNSHYEFCLPKKYRCVTGEYIDRQKRNSFYYCPVHGTCLPIATLCDGTIDCPTKDDISSVDERNCRNPVISKPQKVTFIEKYEGERLGTDDLVCEARFFGRPQIIFLKNWKYLPETGMTTQKYINDNIVEQNGHRGLTTCEDDKFETKRTKKYFINRGLQMSDAGIYTCEFTDIGNRRAFSYDMILVIKRTEVCRQMTTDSRAFHNIRATNPSECFQCNCLNHQKVRQNVYCTTEPTARAGLKQSHHAQVTMTKYNQQKMREMTEYSGAFDKDMKYGGAYKLEAMHVSKPWEQYLTSSSYFNDIPIKYTLYDAIITYYIRATSQTQEHRSPVREQPDIVIMSTKGQAIGAYGCYPQTINTSGVVINVQISASINIPSQLNTCHWKLIPDDNNNFLPKKATPGEIMKVLEHFQSFRFKYNLNNDTRTRAKTSISIINVTYADFETREVETNLASWIPLCICKEGYRGNWCQNCDAGYERSPTKADPYRCVQGSPCARGQFLTKAQICVDCNCGLRGTLNNKPNCTEDHNVYEASVLSLKELDSYTLDVDTTDKSARMVVSQNSYGTWEDDRNNYLMRTSTRTTVTEAFRRYIRVRFDKSLNSSYIKAFGLRVEFVLTIEASSTDKTKFAQARQGLSMSEGGTPEIVIANRERECIYFDKISKMKIGAGNKMTVTLSSGFGWKYCGSGQYATRDQIMMVLSSQPESFTKDGGIYIRVQYYTDLDLTARISLVRMYYMTHQATDVMLHGIEKCIKCPPGITGSRCTECKTGVFVWRVLPGSTYQCVDKPECHCNSLSKCDKGGKCIKCKNYTAGSHCEFCISGYYGNPELGIPCLQCHCPGVGPKFTASRCITETTEHGYSYKCLFCHKGYTGLRCDDCSTDYTKQDDGTCTSEADREDGELECDPWGTKLATTNRKGNPKCYCKTNVLGNMCKKCAPNTYKVDNHTTVGCSKCVCSHVTNRCVLRKYRSRKVDLIKTYENMAKSKKIEETIFASTLINEKLLGFATWKEGISVTYPPHQILTNDILRDYFVRFPKEVLPQVPFTMNGNWSYTMSKPTGGFKPDKEIHFDRIAVAFQSKRYDGKEYVIGISQATRIAEFTLEQKFSGRFTPESFSELNMHNFGIVKRGVTEERMRFVMSNLKAAYIHIPLVPGISYTLSSFNIDIISQQDSTASHQSEVCTCPQGYDGDSCQICASGYTRDGRRGPDGSYDMKDKCMGK